MLSFESFGLIDSYHRLLLSRSQHAYVRDKSVQTALHDVTDFGRTNLARGECALFPLLCWINFYEHAVAKAKILNKVLL